MRSALAITAALAFTGCAPYASVALESSDRPAREGTARLELGGQYRALEVYAYHESDPSNGLDKRQGEAENGAGARLELR